MGALNGQERASVAHGQGALPRVGEAIAGKYRIERLVRRGGMGAVFAAWHELLRQPVALKVLLSQTANSPDAVARFLNEARAAASIQGEHVARVLDVGLLDGGAPFIVFELLEGRDLDELIGASGPLPVADAVDYLLQ